MTDPAMTDEIAKIMSGLSEAQRDAILSCHEDDKRSFWFSGTHCTILRALWNKGIGSYRARPSRLTPLGLAVRAALLKGPTE